MIGVFDSGRGGALAVRCLHEKIPRADVAFFGDSANAPYGTKTEEQLLPLIEKDIDRLKAVGSERILSACCTASSLYGKLPDGYREICFPIISPTADLALRKTRNQKIGVLATLATVRSHVFRDAILSRAPDAEVTEIPAQRLVTLAEAGRTDKDDETVKLTCRLAAMAFSRSGIDTLILGCTHFPWFADSFSAHFPGVCIVSSVEAGVGAFIESLPEHEKNGRGRIFYLT